MITATRTHTSIGALALTAILLTGCGASPNPDIGAGSSASETAKPPAETSDSVSAEPVNAYLACLHEHGLDNAVTLPDGSVGYEFDEDDLADGGVITAESGDTTAIEAACLEEVPGYTPPDENER